MLIFWKLAILSSDIKYNLLTGDQSLECIQYLFVSWKWTPLLLRCEHQYFIDHKIGTFPYSDLCFCQQQHAQTGKLTILTFARRAVVSKNFWNGVICLAASSATFMPVHKEYCSNRFGKVWSHICASMLYMTRQIFSPTAGACWFGKELFPLFRSRPTVQLPCKATFSVSNNSKIFYYKT